MMMDEHTAQLMAAVARVEEGVKGCSEDIKELKEIVLENHGDRLDSLEGTRDKQKGIGIVASFLVAITAGIVGFFKHG
jgi:hypothetical protein